jgi:serine/threonine protein kinase
MQATKSVADITVINTYKLDTYLYSTDRNDLYSTTLGRHGVEAWLRVRKIGEGGFGSVWLEKKRSTGELRAVKKIYLEKSRNFPYARELNALIKVCSVSSFSLPVSKLLGV